MPKKLLKISPLLALLVSSVLCANTADELESMLQDVSDIATNTLVNVDYLPSVVTVVKIEELKLTGARNLTEALQRVPGIQIYISELGYTMTTVRGFKNPNAYLSDKIKLLIDGVAINSDIFGSNQYYMNLPIDLIERIEVLRGPASVNYGSGALYGAVNVITKIGAKSSNCSSLYSSYGSFDYALGALTFCSKTNALKIDIDAYYQSQNKGVALDSSYIDTPHESFPRDMESNEDMEDYALGIALEYKNFELTARFKESHQGNFYGYEGRLEPENDMGMNNKSYFLELKNSTTLGKGVALNTKVGMGEYLFKSDARHRRVEYVNHDMIYDKVNETFRYREDGVLLHYLPNTTDSLVEESAERLYLDDDKIYSQESSEKNYHIETSLQIDTFVRHRVRIGTAYSYSELGDNYFNDNFENTLFENLDYFKQLYQTYPDARWEKMAFFGEPALETAQNHLLLQDAITREIFTIYAQDQYTPHRDIDITAGIRYDHYSDFGDEFNLKLGAVYRATDAIIFKAMYGSSYRAPTWMEAYALPHVGFRAGNEKLQPEKANTYELALIYKPKENHRFSINAYYAELTDVIDIEEDYDTLHGYTNFDKRYSKGIEAEYALKIDNRHKISLNYSYGETTYTTPEELITQLMPDYPRHALKGYHIYSPTPKLSFATTFQYLSETTKNEEYQMWVGHKRQVYVDQELTFDETITYNYDKKTEIRLLVKNILDEEIRMPSYYYRNSEGILREGRSFYFTLSRAF